MHVHFPTLTIIASNKMRNNSLHHAERLMTILTALKSDKFFESFLDIWEQCLIVGNKLVFGDI